MENIPSNSVGTELIHGLIFGSTGDVQEASSWLMEQLLDVDSPHWNAPEQSWGGSQAGQQPLLLGESLHPTSPHKETGMQHRGKKLAAALIMSTGKNSDIARKVLLNIAQYPSHKNK